MKQYIPVDVITKQIEFLKGLMEYVGQNDGIESVIRNLQIVNAPKNRVDERDIYRAVQLENFEEDARAMFDTLYSSTYSDFDFDFKWLAEQHDQQFCIAEYDQWRSEIDAYIIEHDIKNFYEEA